MSIVIESITDIKKIDTIESEVVTKEVLASTRAISTINEVMQELPIFER